MRGMPDTASRTGARETRSSRNGSAQSAASALHQVAHQLKLVSPLGRRVQELRFEQLVQAEQRGIAPQLVANQAVRRLRTLGSSVALEQRCRAGRARDICAR